MLDFKWLLIKSSLPWKSDNCTLCVTIDIIYNSTVEAIQIATIATFVMITLHKMWAAANLFKSVNWGTVGSAKYKNRIV